MPSKAFIGWKTELSLPPTVISVSHVGLVSDLKSLRLGILDLRVQLVGANTPPAPPIQLRSGFASSQAANQCQV